MFKIVILSILANLISTRAECYYSSIPILNTYSYFRVGITTRCTQSSGFYYDQTGSQLNFYSSPYCLSDDVIAVAYLTDCIQYDSFEVTANVNVDGGMCGNFEAAIPDICLAYKGDAIRYSCKDNVAFRDYYSQSDCTTMTSSLRLEPNCIGTGNQFSGHCSSGCTKQINMFILTALLLSVLFFN